MRIKVLKEYLVKLGYDCVILNIGESRKYRKYPHTECVNVSSMVDFLWKVIWYLIKGYVIHMHINGKSIKILWMALYTQGISVLFIRRAFLTFHAGVQQEYFPKNKNIFLTIMFFMIFTLSKKIICNAQPVKDKIKEYGIKDNKIVPIPGFTLQYLQFNKVDLPDEIEKFLQAHEPVLFSYICFLEEYTVDVFIEVIEELRKIYPDIGVILILRVEDNRDEFETMIKSKALDKIIMIRSNLSHDEFLTLITRVKLYVRTPKDGICSSVLEAIALGTPVVASENECRPREAILFKYGDKNDMLDKILYVLNNYDIVKAQTKFEGKDSLDEEVELLISG
jgi:glycosyltransferase involved in cell wall biosynthesis